MMIEIKSRPINLMFGYSCYKTLMNGLVKFKDKYMEQDGNFTAFGLAKLIHAGYENHCLDKDISPAISFDDVLEWVDDCVAGDGKEKLAEIINAWSASVHIKRLTEEAQQKKSEEATLSLQTSISSNPSVTENSASGPGNSGE